MIIDSPMYMQQSDCAVCTVHVDPINKIIFKPFALKLKLKLNFFESLYLCNQMV